MMTLSELKEALGKFPDDASFYGWDDGSIIIVAPDDSAEIGFIDPGHYIASDKKVETRDKEKKW